MVQGIFQFRIFRKTDKKYIADQYIQSDNRISHSHHFCLLLNEIKDGRLNG